MRPSKIKQMWRDGKYVTLGWLSVSHGFTAEVMARQGFDALCIDLQHGTSELNDLWPLLQAISQTHLSLAKDAPRCRQPQVSGHITSVPILHGLHHAYVRM